MSAQENRPPASVGIRGTARRMPGLSPVFDVPGRLVRHLAAEEGLDDVEGHVHPGGDARRGDDAVVDHPGGALDGDAGAERVEEVEGAPVGGGAAPLRRPALASRRAPVQTEVTWRAAAAVRRIQPRVSSSLSRRRVPNPPGTTRRSIRGASAKPKRGTTVSPPVAVTGSRVRATVKTWNGAPSSERRASTPGLEAGAREDLERSGEIEDLDVVEEQDADVDRLREGFMTVSFQDRDRPRDDTSSHLFRRRRERESKPVRHPFLGWPWTRLLLCLARASRKSPLFRTSGSTSPRRRCGSPPRSSRGSIRPPGSPGWTRWPTACAPAWRAPPATSDRVGALAGFLADEVGLRGNAEDYYDPRNSLLNEVLARGLGIPITLALVHIEVGRRAGVPLDGVGFPGHFLLRHSLRPQLLFDPFDRGRPLTEEDCRAMLDRLSGGALAFDPAC